jgi:hypothetical protein
VDQNTTVVFPAPLMSTIQELGNFLAREQTAATPPPSAQQSAASTVQRPAAVDQRRPATGRG